MVRRIQPHKKKTFEEHLVYRFPQGCPYCDEPISYDQFNLKTGENEIQCLSCKKTYIKVVSDSHKEEGNGRPPSVRRGKKAVSGH